MEVPADSVEAQQHSSTFAMEKYLIWLESIGKNLPAQHGEEETVAKYRRWIQDAKDGIPTTETLQTQLDEIITFLEPREHVGEAFLALEDADNARYNIEYYTNRNLPQSHPLTPPRLIATSSPPPVHDQQTKTARKKESIAARIAKHADNLARCLQRAYYKPGHWETLASVERVAHDWARGREGISTKVTAAAVWTSYKERWLNGDFGLDHQHFCRSCKQFLRVGCCDAYDKKKHRKIWIVKNCHLGYERLHVAYGRDLRGRPTRKGGVLPPPPTK